MRANKAVVCCQEGLAMTLDTHPNPNAILQFLSDWREAVKGELLRGGTLGIEFAPERLTGCRRNWRGAEVWDIEALVRFHPRGDLAHGSLLVHTSTDGIVSSSS